MRAVVRILLGGLTFAAVLLVGYALGVRPTLAEAIVVILACAASDITREALR